VIRRFKDKATERLWLGAPVPRFASIKRQALRKLDMLDSAARLDDLRVPPGNHLEALKGDRKGRYAIRINDQWRISFVWSQEGPDDVEIVDYH
jgi:proteic killer suppression protein